LPSQVQVKGLSASNSSAQSWLNANVVAPLKQAGNNALAKIKDVVDGLAKGVQALKNITQVVAGAAKTFIGDKVEKAITSFVKFFCDTAEKIISKALDLARTPARIINGIIEGGTRRGLFDVYWLYFEYVFIDGSHSDAEGIYSLWLYEDETTQKDVDALSFPLRGS